MNVRRKDENEQESSVKPERILIQIRISKEKQKNPPTYNHRADLPIFAAHTRQP